MDERIKCDIYIYMTENTIQLKKKKEGSPAHLDNMSKSWEHYSKRDKSGKDRCCMISLFVESKTDELIETESTLMAVGD